MKGTVGIIWCLFFTISNAVAQPVSDYTVTDLAGRQVVIDGPVSRIILGESRYIMALSMLDKKQPFARIVGMLADLKQVDFGSYQQYQSRFPEIDDIALVGHSSADSFSVEKVLTLDADLAIFGVEGHGPNARHSQLIQQLENAGVAVIFVDFRKQPLKNTVRSMTLLGKVLGKEKEAKAFTDFYEKQLARIVGAMASKAAFSQERPSVFLHSRVGLQDLCCETMVRGMMAAFLEAAGGENIAKPLVPGAAGVMNLEYLLTMQPDIYIATGIGSTTVTKDVKLPDEDTPPYIVLGAGVEEDVARQSFQRAISKIGVRELTAIKSKRAFAIWHHFYNTPLNVVAVQAFATWLYPEEFADVDPRDTLQQLFDQFLPVPLSGTYWVGLDNAESQQ